MTCEHCAINHKEYCPKCGALLKQAQDPLRICDNCDWAGHYTFVELGNLVHLFTKRAMRQVDSDRAKADLYNAQNYINIMQAKLDDIKKNL